jgi:hypothetical protein
VGHKAAQSVECYQQLTLIYRKTIFFASFDHTIAGSNHMHGVQICDFFVTTYLLITELSPS